MLRQVEYIVMASTEERLNGSLGSVIHGALMELIPSDLAWSWHENALRPFSQGVYYDNEGKQSIWRLNTLTDEAGEVLNETLVAQGGKLLLKQKGWELSFCEQKRRELSAEQIEDEAFGISPSPKTAEVRFLSTTSFKQNGGYVMVPDTCLILRNLIDKWNTFGGEKLKADNLPQELATFLRLSRYRLNSQAYSVDGHFLTGFAGRMRFRLFGTDMGRRLCKLLLLFAPFAGVGIKTALGMGVTDTEVKE